VEEAGFEGASEMFPGLKIDGVTRRGTIIYADGESAILDSGNRLEVSEGIKQQGLEIALAMAIKRFGRHVVIEGNAAFRDRVLHVACALKLDIAFTDRTEALTQSVAPGEEQAQKQAAAPQEPASLDPDPGLEAARRYIAEREMRRRQIAGIPRHVLGEAKPHAEMIYAGWRRVDGQFLLLASSATDEVAVIPVDAAAIARIAQVRRGDVITLNGRVLSRSRGLAR
jgi:hypothetical protein